MVNVGDGLQGITSIGDALEAQANSAGRRLSEGQEAVEGLTLSVALLGESRESFRPKQVTPTAPRMHLPPHLHAPTPTGSRARIAWPSKGTLSRVLVMPSRRL